MTSYNYSSGLNYGKGIGAIPKTIGNPDLRWERTLSSNVGIDLTMLKGRFDLSFDAYIKNTDDLLVNVTRRLRWVSRRRARTSARSRTRVSNCARASCRIQTKDLQWSWSLTYAYNKGRIKRISNALQAQNLVNRDSTGVRPLPIYEEAVRSPT